MIETAEKELFVLEKKRRAIKGSKASKNDKKTKLKPIDDEIKVLRLSVSEMLYVKD